MLFHTFFDFFSFRSPAMQLKKGFKRAKNHEFSLQSKKFKSLLRKEVPDQPETNYKIAIRVIRRSKKFAGFAQGGIKMFGF